MEGECSGKIDAFRGRGKCIAAPLERRFVPIEERGSTTPINDKENSTEGDFLRPALNMMRSAGPDRGVVHSVRRDSIDQTDSGLSEFSYFS